jgi:hypothetical protein
MTTAIPTSPATATPVPLVTKDQYIAPALFGRDHWTTLAYIESVMADCGGFQLGLDPRMRSNRRNFRVMSEVSRPKRAKNTSVAARPMSPDDGSRLKDGQLVRGHDDWNCVDDFAAVGFFDCGPVALGAGKTLRFSALGKAVAARLRQHKQEGGQFEHFDLASVPEATQDAMVPPREEFFQWAGMSFNVAALIADIAAGKVRPKVEALDQAFITDYCTKMLALDKANPLKKSFSLFIAVDGPRANAMPLEVLAKPVLFAYVGKNKGVLNLDGTGAHYVLIDGNHRMGKAFFTNTPALPALVINQTQIRPYKD